jgi:hypothetical protein
MASILQLAEQSHDADEIGTWPIPFYIAKEQPQPQPQPQPQAQPQAQSIAIYWFDADPADPDADPDDPDADPDDPDDPDNPHANPPLILEDSQISMTVVWN